MDEQIEKYLIEEHEIQSPVVRERLTKKVLKHKDIAEEFLRWLVEREYRDGVIVNGWTARQIHEAAADLDGIGVYNFLVTLRDEPEVAQQIIKEEFQVE